MKGRSLFNFTVGLVILSAGELSRIQSATAAPAPAFRPIVRDIQNRLPRGMVMRLPAFINFRNITTVYPILEPYESGRFRISLTSEPGCRGRYCELGYIAGIRRDSYYGSSDWEWARTEQKTGTSITLRRGVRGVYINVIRGGAVIWEQDGLVFIVSLGGDKQKIIDTAISMANESPIYDIARSNSQIATGRSPSTGGQIAAGRSPANGGETATGGSQNTERTLIVAANSPSISGVTVEFGEFTKEPNKRRSTYAFMVDRVNYKDLSDGSIVLSCVVWNLGFGDGVMEVRNARGELVEVRGIDGMRNPTSVVSFPIEYAQRLWEFVNEPKPDGLGFLGDPTSSFVGTSKKTEIKNIVIPPGGALRLTKNGENAVKYNLAKGVMDILFDKGLPKIFENNSYKVRLLSAIYLKIQQERIGSLAKDGAFITWQDTTRAFATGSWIDEETRDKLAEIGINVLAEELPKYALERVEQQALQQAQRLIAKKVSFWIEATEAFTKNSNFVMQWYDLSMAQRVDPKKSEIIFITQEGN